VQKTLKIVAQNVRRLRIAAGLSQEELAERAGLHRTYVGAIERAERNISIGSLERIARGLGCGVTDLVTPP
jgi:transcriptional regulator with XRE-family HTH domain